MKKFYHTPLADLLTVASADVIAVSGELGYDADELTFSKENGNLFDYRDYMPQ